MSETTYEGLTHRCDDPDCHVPGYVSTLQRMGAPGSGWLPKCSCGAALAPAPAPDDAEGKG